MSQRLTMRAVRKERLPCHQKKIGCCGNSFIRLFALIVLTLGRFGRFAFFESEHDAIAWAGEVSN